MLVVRMPTLLEPDFPALACTCVAWHRTAVSRSTWDLLLPSFLEMQGRTQKSRLFRVPLVPELLLPHDMLMHVLSFLHGREVVAGVSTSGPKVSGPHLPRAGFLPTWNSRRGSGSARPFPRHCRRHLVSHTVNFFFFRL
jgi:hypothetical protein